MQTRFQAVVALFAALPLVGAAQGVAAQARPAERGQVQPPRALQAEPLVAPRIKLPLAKPAPLTVDPPALQGGKPAAPGGYDDAARRCEALADSQQRARCQDKVVREMPVRN